MNKCFILASLVLLASTSLNAAPKSKQTVPPPPALSTREEALKENSSIDEKAYRKTIQASEAQQANVESFLKLQDPTPELRNRPWLWTFALTVQSFRPKGIGQVSNSNFSLDNYGTSVMPAMELGFLAPVTYPTTTWDTGLGARVGYTAQKTTLITPSGYKFDDARLSSGLFSLVWNNRLTVNSHPKWSALINPEVGIVNYTQTATNNTQANFNQQNNFWGVGVGAEYSFNKKWGMTGQYSYRQAGSGKKDVTDLQQDNFEIGTSVVW